MGCNCMAKGWFAPNVNSLQVVVCIVSDGRKKIDPRVLNVLGVMGCYQEGIMKNTVNEKQVTSHVFEYTAQMCVDPSDGSVRGSNSDIVPVQILFCLKEQNKKKVFLLH